MGTRGGLPGEGGLSVGTCEAGSTRVGWTEGSAWGQTARVVLEDRGVWS